MTNEEAIRILEDITWNSNRRYEVTDMLDTRNLSIQALQENTKLKAEIERLKSELEQSVKLPCKVGDVVYLVDYEENHIDESIVIDIVYHSASGEFEFETEYLYFYSEDLEDDYIFFTREEAEQSLKGQVSE